jgi:hypothetical protein
MLKAMLNYWAIERRRLGRLLKLLLHEAETGQLRHHSSRIIIIIIVVIVIIMDVVVFWGDVIAFLVL